MSNIIIAGEAKRKVIAVLRESDHLSKLYYTWPELASELEVDEVNIIALQDGMLVKTCSIWKAVSAIIEDWVSRKGSAATLDVLGSALEERGLKYIRERLEKEFGINKEQHANNVNETLLNDTLPETIPYSIPRTLVSWYILEIEKLFETAAMISDVFCFTGIQRFELANYVKNSTTDNSSMQIQMQQFSTRYIILDRDTHFTKICSKTKEPVHLIEFSQDDEDRSKKIAKWVRSTDNIDVIQRSVNSNSETQEKLTEEQLLKIVKKNKNPVCFSDCPGMGKSILLINVGHKLREEFPDRIIAHFELRLFVQKMKDLKCPNTKSTLESVFSQTLCHSASSKGTEKLNEIFSSDEIRIELLLDGFDEIFPGDVPFCLEIIKDINALKYTRIWIASRPHFLERLENVLNVLGYNIHPFTEENQIQFLSSYWFSQNQLLSKIKLTTLAEKTLEIISSQVKDQNFAGIPLRCFLIAQVFEETAMDFCPVESEHQELPELLTISSTFDLFTKMIELKFRKYYSTYGITKYRQSALTRMLMKLAMDLIFPGQLGKLNATFVNLEVSVSDLINTGLLLRQGADDLNGIKFVHQTIAEYFCAKFVFDSIKQYEKGKEWIKERKEFLLLEVLRLDSNALSVLSREFTYEDSDTTEYCFKLFWEFALSSSSVLFGENGTIETVNKKCLVPFAHPVVCYFLNSLLYKERLTPIPGIDSDCALASLKEIIWVCMPNNFLNIFKLLTCEPLSYYGSEIFDHDFLFILLHYGQLDFVQTGFNCFEKYQILDLELKRYVLSHVGILGNYSVFEYFCEKKKFKEVLLDDVAIHILVSIINDSVSDDINEGCKKIQIISYILSVNPSLVKTIPVDTFRQCHAKLLHCLIELGLDVEAQNESSGDTIFHFINNIQATVNQLYEIICLIQFDKFKRLVQIKNNNGETILFNLLAKFDVSISILDQFKYAHADFNACDKYGNSLLMQAFDNQNSVEIIRYLLNEGADPNHVNKNGSSVLFVCEVFFGRGTWEELIKAGCDVFRQEEGCTFLHRLLNFHRFSFSADDFREVVQILVANGKEKLLEAKSEEEPKLTPLQVAVKRGKMHKQTVTLLKSIESLNCDIDKLLEEEVPNDSDSDFFLLV